MIRTSKTFSVSLSLPLAEAVDRTASRDKMSAGLRIADIVEKYFLHFEASELPEKVKTELSLLRGLRDEAIGKLNEIMNCEGFSETITLKTFQACQKDADWLERYEQYIRGYAIAAGNPRKTNANQTIGSRIKSELGARDLVDASGKLLRGRAPAGSIIQTYQLLQLA